MSNLMAGTSFAMSSPTSSSSAQLTEPPFLSKLTPLINEALLAILEHRPENPLQFCAEFFAAKVNGSPTPSLGSSPSTSLLHNRQKLLQCIANQFFASNPIADPNTGELSLKAAQFHGVLTRSCIEFPPEIASAIIKVLGSPTKEDSFTLRELISGVNACLIFNEFFEEAEQLFSKCQMDRDGRIARIAAETILKQIAAQSNEFNVPSPEQSVAIMRFLDELQCTEHVSFRQFILAVFHTTELPIDTSAICAAPNINSNLSKSTASMTANSASSTVPAKNIVPKPQPAGQNLTSSAASSTASALSVFPTEPINEASTMTLASMLTCSSNSVGAFGASTTSNALANIDLTSLLSSLNSYEGGQTARGGQTPK